MDIQNIVLLIVVIINLVLGVIIYFHSRKEKVNQVFVLVVVSVALWAFSMILYRTSVEIDIALLWCRILYTSAVLVVCVFLYFTHIFPTGKSISWLKRFLIIIPTIILLVLVWSDQLVIRWINIIAGQEKEIIWGPWYFLYVSYILIFFTWGFGVLMYYYGKATGVVKIQIKYVLIGMIVAAVTGVGANLILPSLGIFKFNWFGQLGTVIMISFVAYAIVKHHLLNIKVVATELLTVFILAILLVQLFLSGSLTEAILRFSFLIVVGFLGFLLIKSVLVEVKRKEELQILSQKLAVANKELKRLDQAKSEFLSIASHQLRTPLTAIKGYASMLLDGTYGKMTAKVNEGVDKVSQSTQRMIDLVNDLLNTSRLESGRMEFKFEPIQLADLAAGVVDELILKAQEKGLVIDWQKPAQVLPQVKADQTKLRQVVMNLVDNAIKYTEKGKVVVGLKQQGRDLIFSVKDSGAGLSRDEMGFLFKKFSRGRGEVSHIKGSGLGLYVARRIMEVHGGKIWAKSTGPGKGSTFAFSLNLDWQPKFDGVYKPDGFGAAKKTP